ncbi:MAG: tRNA (guanosine(37)-N1)-methyltransferase TrmD [Candidatus Omnitrophica bacterium]|nr:tRNA (guanosine(37)-N1)-methyltransferase TrmD [Candidatus Omnitrophota bacterium]
MIIDVITLFPEMFSGVLSESMLKRAQESGALEMHLHNLRDYSRDKHKKVDDRPFGGGPGMVIRPEPVFDAVAAIRGDDTAVPLIFLSPQGDRLCQGVAEGLTRHERIILLCGHYEGIDERVRAELVTMEISIGDYVLTCGEIPAMVLIDTVARLIPGVLGDADSLCEESFQNSLLEYPQYTRPRVYKGLAVPDVLLSGDHERIDRWRKAQARKRTKERRPELLEPNAL